MHTSNILINETDIGCSGGFILDRSWAVASVLLFTLLSKEVFKQISKVGGSSCTKHRKDGVVCSARIEAVYTTKWVKFNRGVSAGTSMSLSPPHGRTD